LLPPSSWTMDTAYVSVYFAPWRRGFPMDASKPTRQRRRLLRDERGSIMIEFALVGPMFLLMMLGILELSLMMFSQAVLDGAARAAARTVRTGQAQLSGNPGGTFQQALCDNLAGVTGLIPCGSVAYNVQTFASFTAAAAAAPPSFVDANGNPIQAFSPGGPSSYVVVQVVYTRKFITQSIGPLLGIVSHGAASTGWNSALLTSNVVFMNEPYP
jgi:Flp pilus assembly protein TadG